MSERRLEWVSLEALKPARRNPKRHEGEALSASVGRFGYVEPVVLDERTGCLVAGHGRREALLKMRAAGEAPPEGVRTEGGRWLVPVLRGWALRSDTEAEAYLLASNRLVEVGGWDNESLAELVAELAKAQALEGVGFSEEDVYRLLEDVGDVELKDGDDDAPEPPAEEDVWVKPGQLYEAGGLRLLCGDSTKPEDVARVLRGERARLCWTDPPWNVAYGETKNPSGKQRSIANDNLGEAFPAFCRDFVARIAEAVLPGAPLYMAMSAQEWPTIDAALREAGFHWSSTLIWAKDSLVLSRKDYHTQYEPIWYGWREGAPRLREVEDRKQSDVWSIPRPKKSEEHPTMKPVELVVRALLNSSRPKDLVFEPFSGSGTTLLAAHRTKRRCAAVELEPKYVQVALERLRAVGVTWSLES